VVPVLTDITSKYTKHPIVTVANAPMLTHHITRYRQAHLKLSHLVLVVAGEPTTAACTGWCSGSDNCV
jgi:hypothetical protein